ncbi:MAG: M6 family metalloprotease domain-containing protein [Candidatus Hydrogenedentota bacterium]
MAKKVLVFLVYILISAHNIYAVPAKQQLHQLRQPDNTPVNVKQIGDENYAYFETQDGYIVARDQDGWIKYLSTNLKDEFQFTDLKVNIHKPDNLVPYLKQTKKPLKINHKNRPKITEIQKTENIFKKLPDNKKKNRWVNFIKSKIKTEYNNYSIKQNESSHKYTILDPIENILVIRIDFTDKKGEVSQNIHRELLFGNQNGSLKHYFYENSYGNLVIAGDISGNDYYHSSFKMEFYGEDDNWYPDNANTPIYELTREAVRLADKDVDFSKYDKNNDCVVDHLIIIHSGYDQAENAVSTDIWSHSWWLPDSGEPVDGVYVKNYIMVSEYSPLGVIAHEFFHDLGAPDLYDFDFDGFPVSEFCLMSYGVWLNDGKTPSNICSYLKMDIDADASNGYAGWLAPVEISDSITRFLQVQPLSGWTELPLPLLYRINTQNPSEYFLCDFRKKQNYDSYLPDEGLCIWHIDESIPERYGSFNSEEPYRINLISPEPSDYYKQFACFDNTTNNGEISPFTTPGTILNNNEYTCIYLSNMSSVSDTISLIYKTAPGPPAIISFGVSEITGNNNNVPEYNEKLSLTIEIKNIGYNTLTEVAAEIGSTDNDLKILNNQGFYGNIEPQKSNISNDFIISISDSLFQTKIIELPVLISDNNKNVWYEKISLKVYDKFKIEEAISIDTNTVNIIFSHNLNPNSITDLSNYTIISESDSSILQVISSTLFDSSTIQLKTKNQKPAETYKLIINNIVDEIENIIPFNSTTYFLSSVIETYEIEKESIHKIELDKYRPYEPVIPFKQVPPPLNTAKSQPRISENKEIFGFYPYWASTSNWNYDLISTVSFFSVEAASDGSLTDLNSWPNYSILTTLHQKGIKIVLTCTLFGGTNIATLVASSTYRSNLINNLKTQVKNGNAEGVCIDFEYVSSSSKNNFTTFMTELRDAFKNENPDYIITMAGPAIGSGYGYDYDALADRCDYIFIMAYDYHWSGGDPGPVAPLYPSTFWSTVYNDSYTVTDYQEKIGVQASCTMVLGIPYYGYNWPSTDYDTPGTKRANASSITYTNAKNAADSWGRIWDPISSTPWYKYGAPSDTRQVWYDDSQSIRLKYSDMVKAQDLRGAGMWALGYDGSKTELWQAIEDYFGTPSPPVLIYAKNIGSGKVRLSWLLPTQSDFDKSRVYQSTNGENFSLVATLNNPTNTYDVSGLTNGNLYYFAVTAVDTGNNESRKSEIFAVSVTSGTPTVLVVADDNRYIKSAYAQFYARPLYNNNYSFDYCDSYAIVNDIILLSDYDVVIWYTGRDSTGGSRTFTSAEQTRVQSYLDSGGNFFVSGQELGYDLDYQGGGVAFYNNYLKADYSADDAGNSLAVSGVAGGIFDGISFTIDRDDNGGDSGGAYDATYPDSISAYGGGILCLRYSTGSGAGVNFNDTYRLVHFAFPFETITTETARISVIQKIMDYFAAETTFYDVIAPAKPTLLSLTNNGNDSITIRWKNPADTDISYIKIYKSTDGSNFSVSDTQPALNLTTNLSGLTNSLLYYFALTIVDSSGNESTNSDTYCIRISTDTAPILIVEDDNRYGVNNYSKYYGESLREAGYYFDNASAEAVVGDTIFLDSYSAVIWFTSRDSKWGYITFTDDEETKARNYLKNGGNLFTTGQEIGYDLDGQNLGEDFYFNYLKSFYSADDAGNNVSVNGISGGIFDGLSFAIDADNGINDGGAYDATYPDSIGVYPGGDGSLNLLYSNYKGAGVNFSGTVPAGSETCKVVNFGFPFECITTSPNRKLVIQKIMEYFNLGTTDTPVILVSPLQYTKQQAASPWTINLVATDNQDTTLYLNWSLFDTDATLWDSMVITEGETDYLTLYQKTTGVGSDTFTLRVEDSDGYFDTVSIVVLIQSIYKPDTPIFQYIVNNLTGTSVNLCWYDDTYASKYWIYQSTDGSNFILSDTIFNSETSATLTGRLNNTLYYFRLKGLNNVDTESDFSDMYAVRTTANPVDLLIVEDDNRYGSNDYIINYAKALDSFSYNFNCCSREAIADGYVSLLDYDKVIWFTSKDSNWGEGTFYQDEQAKIIEYLEDGGNLFVSGNEIGYDLDYKNNGQSFYNNYLKADYGADDSLKYKVVGSDSGIFDNLLINIYTDDAGSTQGISAYQAKWPDRFSFTTTGYNNSQTAMQYESETGYAAGIQFAGGLETSDSVCKLVHLGFAFEIINDTAARNEVMRSIINFFDSSCVSGKINLEDLTYCTGGATVYLIKSDNSETQVYTTGENGFFSFVNVASGDYYLRVRKSGFLETKTDNFSVTNNIDTYITSITLSGGDAYEDNMINLLDAALVKICIDNSTYDTNADINKDNVVNYLDLQYIRLNFGAIGK